MKIIINSIIYVKNVLYKEQKFVIITLNNTKLYASQVKFEKEYFYELHHN